MVQQRPARVRGSAHDEFWRWCDSAELRIQRCETCRHLSWPPAVVCERCGDTALEWERMAGKGTIVSWCTFERRYYEELEVPWDTILVELDEGPLFLSNPHGFSIDDDPCGTRVQVTFVPCEDEHGPFHLPVFRDVT